MLSDIRDVLIGALATLLVIMLFYGIILGIGHLSQGSGYVPDCDPGDYPCEQVP